MAKKKSVKKNRDSVCRICLPGDKKKKSTCCPNGTFNEKKGNWNS